MTRTRKSRRKLRNQPSIIEKMRDGNKKVKKGEIVQAVEVQAQGGVKGDDDDGVATEANELRGTECTEEAENVDAWPEKQRS